MQIVFMGTPEFAVPPLEHLLINKYRVVAVYTQPDRPAGRGRSQRVWNVQRQERLFTLRGHARPVHTLSWSPNGNRIASGSQDQTVRVWDMATGQTTIILRSHEKDVRSVEWSPDGRILASASSDMTIKLWDSTRGYEQAEE